LTENADRHFVRRDGHSRDLLRVARNPNLPDFGCKLIPTFCSGPLPHNDRFCFAKLTVWADLN
jgi:hypothetical protein